MTEVDGNAEWAQPNADKTRAIQHGMRDMQAIVNTVVYDANAPGHLNYAAIDRQFQFLQPDRKDSMFSHIMLGANDIQQSKKFYDAILGVLGHEPGIIDEKGRCFWYAKRGVFSISKPIDGQPASRGNGSTIGFSARTPELVDAWHAAGISNGGATCEDPPGLRDGVAGKLYLAYLLDPAGNKICALHRVTS